MLKLHPEILVKNGKKEFVVLPYEEFLAMQERLADAEDLVLRQGMTGGRVTRAQP